MPIFGIEKSNLSDFTTTEKDMKRMVSKYPPDQLRMYSEDIIKQAETSQTTQQMSKMKLTDG